MMRIILGTVFAIIFLLCHIFLNDKFTSNSLQFLYFTEIALLFISLCCFFPKKNKESALPKGSKKLPKSTLLAILFVLIIVPLTIFFGMHFLYDKKYNIISILIIAEIIIPFLFTFEKKGPDSKNLIIISVLCALAVCGRFAFSFLPQFKPTLAIVIISGVVFGGETGFLVGSISAFVSNMFFGQGPWTPWQMFAFGTTGFIAGFIFKSGLLRKNRVSMSIYGGFSTMIIYGLIANLGSAFLMYPNPNFKMIISTIMMGVPYDLVHAASTVLFLWFISEPLCEKTERIKTKYGI